jgi:uncharacterized membrane protein
VATASIAAAPLRSRKKLIFFALFFAATIFVTYMKNARILDPASPIAQHFAPVKWYLVAHGVFGGLAMVLGAFQFSNRLRARYLPVHRTLGYIYVTSVFISAPMSIPMAMKIHTISIVFASVAQSLGWMGTTAMALYCIRHGNIAQHRRWMILSYPYAMVFTVARLIVPIPGILSRGEPAIETVVWSTIFMAAFLPPILLDRKAIFAAGAAKHQVAAR